MKKDLKYWYFVLALTVIVWGTQHPALKVLSGQISPSLLSFIRFALAWIALLPFAARQGLKIEKRDLAIISLLGFVGIFIYGIVGIMGISLSTATNNAILINSWPLMAIALVPLAIKESVSKKQALGMLLGFVGVILVVTNGIGLTQLLASELFAGNLLILFAAACVMAYSLFSKKYIQKYGGLKVAFYAITSGTIFLMLFTILSGEIFAISQIDFNLFLLLLWVAIATTALTWVIKFKSIDKIGVVKTSSFALFIPVSGIIASHLFLKEEITAFTILGTLLILVGIYIVQRKGLEI